MMATFLIGLVLFITGGNLLDQAHPQAKQNIGRTILFVALALWVTSTICYYKLKAVARARANVRE